jgi:hypothetical protein
VSKFLPKKGEFIVAKETSEGNYITKGKVYEVARDTKEHPANYKESLVDLVKDDSGAGGCAFVNRFVAAPVPVQIAAPQKPFPLPAAEVSQGRHFEVRAQSSLYNEFKALTRKSSVADCETFVQQNGANYQGPFEIVEVQIIQRTTVLRKVKREAVTTYKLVDA